MNYTCHSDTGRIKTVFIKNVQQAFTDQQHIEANWSLLNYLGKPDMQVAVGEYVLFESCVASLGAEVFSFPSDAMVNMDSIYCRDASIATDGGMIICRMGKAGRMNEPDAVKSAFEEKGIPVLGRIQSPGTLEGGDVAWLDERMLAVARSYRTNEEGIRQLTELLKPLNVEVITVALPHFKGPADVFHLMSVLSPVDTHLAVIYSPLIPIIFRNLLIERGYELIEVPENEFESMGCNVLALAPGKCLMLEGNPATRSALERAGCEVTLYRGVEISLKGGGGPTCLTRPLYRYK